MKEDEKQTYAFQFLRIIVSVLIFIHGIARIYLGIVDDFGEFLSLNNFPLGFYLAWAITIYEIVGSILLAIGYFITPIAIIFSIQLLFGIFLVHLRDGWFVVGAGRNGIEYSGHSGVYDYKGDTLFFVKDQPESHSLAISYEPLINYRKAFPVQLDADKFEIKS